MRYCRPIPVAILLAGAVITLLSTTERSSGSGLAADEASAAAQQVETGVALLSKHECKPAVTALQRALAARESPEIHILLGLAYDCGGDRQPLISAFNGIWDHDLDPQEPTHEIASIEATLRSGLEFQPRTEEGRYFLCLLYFRVGRYDAALEELGKLGPPVADSWSYHNLLGTIRLRQARFPDARKALEAALVRSEGHADTFYKLGTVAFATGDLHEATSRLQQAIRLRPDFPAASAALGMALLQADEFRAARDALIKGTSVGPEIYVYLGAANERLGDREAATEAYKAAIARQPQLFVAEFSLGRLLLDAGQAIEAAAHLRRATELQPDQAQAHLYLALALISTGQMETAAAAAARAKDTGVHADADFHDALGEVFRTLGRVKEAQQCFERAVSLDQSKEGYFRHLAASQRQAGDESATIATLQTGLAHLPASARLYYLLGLVLMDRGSAGEALESLRKASQLEPSNADYQHSLGLCLAELEKDEEAMACFQRAISLEASHTAAYLQIGLLQLKAGAVKEAEQTFKKVLEIDARYAPAYFHLGKICYDRHDDAEALKLLEKVRDLDPNWEDTYFLLGTLYRRGGDPDQAAGMFAIFRQKKNEVQELRRSKYDRASDVFEELNRGDANHR